MILHVFDDVFVNKNLEFLQAYIPRRSWEDECESDDDDDDGMSHVLAMLSEVGDSTGNIEMENDQIEQPSPYIHIEENYVGFSTRVQRNSTVHGTTELWSNNKSTNSHINEGNNRNTDGFGVFLTRSQKRNLKKEAKEE